MDDITSESASLARLALLMAVLCTADEFCSTILLLWGVLIHLFFLLFSLLSASTDYIYIYIVYVLLDRTKQNLGTASGCL